MEKITVKIKGSATIKQSVRWPGTVVETIFEGQDKEIEVSDGYHTFEELYDHRITLFVALCRHMHELLGIENPGKYKVWRAKFHADGSAYAGWFSMGIGKKPGQQISYHLPMERWDETGFAETLDRAPEWDKHTPADVLERLKNL